MILSAIVDILAIVVIDSLLFLMIARAVDPGMIQPMRITTPRRRAVRINRSTPR